MYMSFGEVDRIKNNANTNNVQTFGVGIGDIQPISLASAVRMSYRYIQLIYSMI